MEISQDAGGFAKRKNRGNIRKRLQEDDSEAEANTSEPGVVRVSKSQKPAPLAFSTKQDSSKRPVAFVYDSNAALQQATDDGATKVLETETETDRDARAQRERVLAQATAGPSAADDSYRGMNSYVDHKKGFRREHTIGAEKGSGIHGPLRASSHIRTTIRFDYQPDICKDYKETGYCGYGDACKFVHDRSDYKSGWELEREWDAREKRLQEAKWEGQDEEEEGEEGEDDLPFACYICRRPWTEVKDPVVTRCKHYFCEQCALKHNASGKGKCAACEQPTNGIFNVATEITKKVKEQKRKEAEADG